MLRDLVRSFLEPFRKVEALEEKPRHKDGIIDVESITPRNCLNQLEEHCMQNYEQPVREIIANLHPFQALNRNILPPPSPVNAGINSEALNSALHYTPGDSRFLSTDSCEKE